MRTTLEPVRFVVALVVAMSATLVVVACGGSIERSDLATDGGPGETTAPTDDASADGTLPVPADANAPDARDVDSGRAPDSGATCAPCPGGCLVGARCLITLATGQVKPGRIAVNGLGVYWTNDGVPDDSYAASAVLVVGHDGGATTTVAGRTNMALGASIDFIAVDSRRVYWVEGFHAWAATEGGTPVALGAWPYYAHGITVDDTSVYLTEGSSLSGLWKLDIDGGSPVKIGSGLDDPSSPVVGGGDAFWFAYNGNGASELYRVRLAGGAAMALPSQLPGGIFFELALGPRDVYLGSGSALMKVDRDGGTPLSLASGYHVAGFALDAENVYFTNFPYPNTGTSVLRASLDGGAPTVLATGLPSAYKIAVDDASVYWTDRGECDGGACTGAVMKLSPK